MPKKLYEKLSEKFLSLCIDTDPLEGIVKEKTIYGSDKIHYEDSEHGTTNFKRDRFFLPVSRELLTALFKKHEKLLIGSFTFIWERSSKDPICSIVLIRNNDSFLQISLRGGNFWDELDVKIEEKLEAFSLEIEKQKNHGIYRFDYIDFFAKFFMFVHSEAQSTYIEKLEERVEELEKEVSSSRIVQKMPVNMFNVMLTTKDATLEKLEKRMREISNKIPKTTDEKRLTQLKKQLKSASEIHKKATLNFPEDFRFGVYEQYAIYGGFKLLHDNKFQNVEMTFTDGDIVKSCVPSL